MNKKGQAETIIDFSRLIINFGLVIIVAVFIVIITLNFISTKFETHNFEAKILVKSLISSKDCLAYNDEIKTFSGVVDLTKFSNERLENCFSNKNLGYTVRLFDINKNELAFSVPESKLLDFLPICSVVKEYKCSKKQNYVLYFKDNKLSPGILITEVITLA